MGKSQERVNIHKRLYDDKDQVREKYQMLEQVKALKEVEGCTFTTVKEELDVSYASSSLRVRQARSTETFKRLYETPITSQNMTGRTAADAEFDKNQ